MPKKKTPSLVPTIRGRAVVIVFCGVGPLQTSALEGNVVAEVFWAEDIGDAVLNALDSPVFDGGILDENDFRVAYIDERNVVVGRTVSLENTCSKGVDEPHSAE
jgi:hypothetical protein